MAYQYLLPITTTAQTATINGATSAYSCLINLSADAQLSSPPLSGTSTLNPFMLNFGASYATGSLVANSLSSIYLTIPTNNGNTVIFGKIISSSVTQNSVSAFNATVKFHDPNFATTYLVLSGFGTGVTLDTTASQLDNPAFALAPDGVYSTTFRGLSSTNVFFRTVGRQVRLIQGYEA